MNDVTPERWLPAVGLEGSYEVSDLGRVRSLDRRARDGRRIAGRMMRMGQHRKTGHPTLHFKRDGVGNSVLVHTLVATTFIGPCPDGHVVRHRDGDPKNCALVNLYYGRHGKLSVQAGQRIGYGVVIDPEIRVPAIGRNGTDRGARLLCDCGNVYVALISRLVGSRLQHASCGCAKPELYAANLSKARAAQLAAGYRPSNFIDRTGQRYGSLVAVKLAGNSESGHTRWLCRCDCGNEITVGAKGLAKGTAVDCGCQPKDPRNKLPSGTAGRNKTLKTYQRNARDRGLSWELGDDDFDRLTSQDCFYCGGTPSNVARGKNQSGDFTYNGIDRVHNDIGYTLDNVVPACRLCNAAKRDLSYDEFTAWLGRLTAHQWFNPDQLPTRLLRDTAA